MSGDKRLNANDEPERPDKQRGQSMKQRWMKLVIEVAETEAIELPWARGKRRTARKAAARARALAA
jgi:hypothetical protein